MENMETYWAIANQTIAIINILIEGWLVYSFVKPFMKKKAYYAKAKEIFDKMALVNCTKCAYCMPCPFGLNIPEIFAAYNMTASHGMTAAKEAYAALETKADACRACHHCEKECPQHIKISEIMPKVAKIFA